MSINRLSKSVSIPYKIIKGSFETRQNKAEQFTNKVINNLSGKIKSDGISLSKLGRDIKKVIPDNLKVFVKKNSALDSDAQLNRIFSDNNYIIKQSLGFKTDKNGKIGVTELPNIAHEVRHLADSLFHPKFLSREQLLAKKGLDTPKLINLYENEVYVAEMFEGKKDKKRIGKIVRYKIKKQLRGLNSQDKIDALQYMRYSLTSENNAFSDGSKCAKKLYKKSFPVYEDLLENPIDEYMFNDKINILKDMIFEQIRKERSTHRAKIKHLSKKKKIQ